MKYVIAFTASLMLVFSVMPANAASLGSGRVGVCEICKPSPCNGYKVPARCNQPRPGVTR